MRIALVSQEYPPETAKGGIGSQTYLKAHGLAARGHQIHVISRSLNGARTDALDQLVKVTRIPGFDQRTPLYTETADWLTYSAEVATVIASLHNESPFDLVEFPEWAAEGYVHLLNRTEWNHIPTAIQLHGPLVMLAHTLGWPDPTSQFYQTGTAMERTCLQLADAVFSSSFCSADWCSKHYGLDRQQIPVLHAGVDTQLFSPRDVPREERPTILFIGKIAPNKGIMTLLQAACLLAREIPNLQLKIVGRGDPSFTEKLNNTAAAAGFPNLLHLAGFLPREELPDQFSKAHVFAAPSLYEGGPGLVYLEAMACALPVIACQGSGAAEVVQGNGLLVPPENVEALLQALRALLTDEPRRQALGQHGRRFVEKEADTRLCIQKIESFYTNVADQHRGGARS